MVAMAFHNPSCYLLTFTFFLLPLPECSLNLRRDDISILSQAESSLFLILDTMYSHEQTFLFSSYKDRTKNGQLKKSNTLITFSTERTGRHTGAFLFALSGRFNEFVALRWVQNSGAMLSLRHRRNPAVTHKHHLSQPNSSLFPTPSPVPVKFLSTQGWLNEPPMSVERN